MANNSDNRSNFDFRRSLSLVKIASLVVIKTCRPDVSYHISTYLIFRLTSLNPVAKKCAHDFYFAFKQ